MLELHTKKTTSNQAGQTILILNHSNASNQKSMQHQLYSFYCVGAFLSKSPPVF